MGAEAVNGESGQFLGFQGEKPCKEGQRGRGPGEALRSTEGHLLWESRCCPPPPLLSTLLAQLSQALPLTLLSSPSLLEAVLRPQHKQVSRCVQWSQRTICVV